MQFYFNQLKYYSKIQISFTKFKKRFHLNSRNDASIIARGISENEKFYAYYTSFLHSFIDLLKFFYFELTR